MPERYSVSMSGRKGHYTLVGIGLGILELPRELGVACPVLCRIDDMPTTNPLYSPSIEGLDVISLKNELEELYSAYAQQLPRTAGIRAKDKQVRERIIAEMLQNDELYHRIRAMIEFVEGEIPCHGDIYFDVDGDDAHSFNYWWERRRKHY